MSQSAAWRRMRSFPLPAPPCHNPPIHQAPAPCQSTGFGDTAASAVGSLLGRTPICHGSRKTVEGTVAAAAATLAAWWLLAAALHVGGGDGGAALGISSWPALVAATTLSCLLEAATTQLDNIFMPLHYFALLCLL